MKSISKSFVICGTDTDIGKTIVSSFFVQGLHATYWKPVQSGTDDGTDSYFFTIIKTGANAYKVMASFTSYADPA